MCWKRFACLLGVGLLVIGFSLPVLADDETDQVEIKVQATLDVVYCGVSLRPSVSSGSASTLAKRTSTATQTVKATKTSRTVAT